jgi:hypothetical protein
MSRVKASQLQIGTLIFQYSWPKILEYEITGINELKTNEHIKIFYLLKCLSCADHEPCELAVMIDGQGYLKFSHMLNQYEDDEEYQARHERKRNHQEYWHTDNLWFTSKSEARIYICRQNIKRHEESKKELTGKIKHHEEEIAKYNELVQAILDECGTEHPHLLEQAKEEAGL